MNTNPTGTTYDGQLTARAAELLPGIGAEERLELLAAMDSGEMSACLSWLATQHPQIFDHALVRDGKLIGELLDRLNEADSAEDDPEPYCSACGASIGIFLTHGPDWHHYRGDGTVASPVELYDADHAPAVAWRENGRYRCCRHCAHGYSEAQPPDRHSKPCPDGCNDGDEDGARLDEEAAGDSQDTRRCLEQLFANALDRAWLDGLAASPAASPETYPYKGEILEAAGRVLDGQRGGAE